MATLIQAINSLSEAERAALEKRFWSKVDKRGPDECWPWMASRLTAGYGQFWVGPGSKGKRHTAHRVAFVLGTRVDPGEGRSRGSLVVCHRCDNPPCCNPAHLFVGTQHDNCLDMAIKGRSTLGDRNPSRLYPERLRRGERNQLSRLTDEQAREIASMPSSRDVCEELARKYGVHPMTIWRVRAGRTFAHIFQTGELHTWEEPQP